MNWAALVPLKPPALRKGRLAVRLSPPARERLSLHLLDRLVAALDDSGRIATIHILSTEPPAGWSRGWIADAGRGLNAEIEAARARLGQARPLLVIHADLPLVGGADIAALLARAEACGIALAPDRHGTGTNAVALAAGQHFAFAFGVGSLARHATQVGEGTVVERPGLALDCDTPADLDLALAAGFGFDPNA